MDWNQSPAVDRVVDTRSGAGRRHRSGKSRPDGAHRRTNLGALSAVAPRIRNHCSDGDQSRPHGQVPSPGDRHHPTRSQPWEYGRPWIEGLNSGDPSGAAYAATTLPLERPNGETARLTAAARQAFERRYATVEITDTVAMRGRAQVALVRNYHDRLQEAVQALESES